MTRPALDPKLAARGLDSIAHIAQTLSLSDARRGEFRSGSGRLGTESASVIANGQAKESVAQLGGHPTSDSYDYDQRELPA